MSATISIYAEAIIPVTGENAAQIADLILSDVRAGHLHLSLPELNIFGELSKREQCQVVARAFINFAMDADPNDKSVLIRNAEFFLKQGGLDFTNIGLSGAQAYDIENIDGN